MWIAGLMGGIAGVLGALLAEWILLALRRRRNAVFIANGELPFKDEIVRPQWIPLGLLGAIGSGVSHAVGARLAIGVTCALIAPAAIVLLGLWFLRPERPTQGR